MEMENSAMSHVMTLQTNMLEEIRELRRKEEAGRMSSVASPMITSSNQVPMFDPLTSMSEVNHQFIPEQYYDAPVSSQATMFKPEEEYEGVHPSLYTKAMSEPTSPISYANMSKLSNVPVVGGSAMIASDTIESVFKFDQSRMSKEEVANYVAERSRGVQEGVVDTTGKVITGAGALSAFAVGGLLPGLAVATAAGGSTAYIAGSMTDGAKTALNYQDMLRNDGYKAFNAMESTTKYGGIGMNLEDQQELSKYMRDLAPEKYLDDSELQGILQGALDNKLLKSTTDVDSFKEKFSKIVDGVKEVAITLNQSLDEAVEMMGEMERRGIGLQDMTKMAAQGKFSASMVGMDAEQYMSQVMDGTDAITSGTSRDAGNVMEGLNFNSYLMSAVEEVSSEGDGVKRNYIKNNGGAVNVATNIESTLRNYAEGQGQDYLMGYMATAFEKQEDGSFKLNEDTLADLTGEGNYGAKDLMSMSGSYVASLEQTDVAKLQRSIGQIFNQTAESEDVYGFTSKVMDIFQTETGIDLDPETALVTMGATNDYNLAGVMSDVMKIAGDGDVQSQFSARTQKEEWDSAALADSPGMASKLKYNWKKNVTNKIGNVGQDISDAVGTFSEDIQMRMAGIEEKGVLGGELLPEFTEESLRELFIGDESQIAKSREALAEAQKSSYERRYGSAEMGLANDLVDGKITDWSLTDKEVKKAAERAKVDKMDYKDFTSILSDASRGKLQEEEIQELRDRVDSGAMDKDSEQMAQYILNKEDGKYEGVFSKGNQAWDRIKANYESADTWVPFSKEEQGSPKEEKEKQDEFDYDTSRRYLDDLSEGTMSASDLRNLQDRVESGEMDKDSKQRAEYIIKKATGEYDAKGWSWDWVSSKSRQAIDKSIAAYQSADTWIPFQKKGGGDDNTMESITQLEGDLKDELKVADVELKTLMTSDAVKKMKSEDYKKLEDSIRSGNIDDVKSLSSNEDIEELTKKYQSIGESTQSLVSAKRGFNEVVMSAAGGGEIASSMFDFVKASNVFDDNEFDDYFKGYKSDATKDAKALKKLLDKGNATDQELFDAASKVQETGEKIFGNMKIDEKIGLADYLVENTHGLNMEDLLEEGSDFSIDSKKLYKEFENVSRLQQSGENAAKEGLGSNVAEATAAAEGHVEAMEQFVGALMSETGTLKKAVSDIETNNFGTHSTKVGN